MAFKGKKGRLDDELVRQGYAQDRNEALRLVMAGLVSLNGERLSHGGAMVVAGVPLHVRGSRRASARGHGVYVSRGGLKLEGALEAFGLVVDGLNCLDVGCSTGGFTHCLLKYGARRVAAVDVGYGQFDWGLRGDPRVDLFERTNICDADPMALGAPFDVAVADVSFTSVEHILPTVCDLLGEGGWFCTLVKPQFEAEQDEVGPGGVVRDPAVHRRVLARVIEGFSTSPLGVAALGVSPVHGAKGNVEYFLLARRGADTAAVGIDEVVDRAWAVNAVAPTAADGGEDTTKDGDR